MNAYRMTPDGSLDMQFLRAMAIYRLLKHGHIDKDKAIELANRRVRGVYLKPGWLNSGIEIWLKGPLKHRSAA